VVAILGAGDFFGEGCLWRVSGAFPSKYAGSLTPV